MPNRISMNVTVAKQTQGATFGEKVNAGIAQRRLGRGKRRLIPHLVLPVQPDRRYHCCKGALTQAPSVQPSTSTGGS
jgi:hypothetical protein